MMAGNSLYYINNLRCSYNGLQEVLHIDELHLSAGKVLFVVGLSGVGKSTFLETLACMHNCIVEGEKTKFDLNFPDNPLSILKTWHRGETAISDLRKQYFSFIFQQSTFLEDCSAIENMSLGAMIKGFDAEQVRVDIVEWMEKLELPKGEIDKNIRHFSGGQRQRMAFIRALVSPFEILFCDEPTGNLDSHTGQILMNSLKQYVRTKNKTAVVVTHDLNSALRYADRLLVIKPKKYIVNGLKQTLGWASNRTFFELSERRESRDINRLREFMTTYVE
jgi:ABC-type lipoprotein export system ATPase subunit